jgi:RNA polymerase sigma factor (sigma-70 family)
VARGANEGESIRAPASFLRAIARNLLLGTRRSARRKTPTVDWAQAVDELGTAEPTAFDDIRIDALRRCSEELTGRSRQAIEQHYLEGHSYRVVAANLGLRVNGVKALLSRTRRTLKDCVQRRTQGVKE